MALIGAWHVESEADREIVSYVADRKYEVIEEDGCSACHQVHGSGNQALLTKPETELCGGCHDTDSRGFTKLHAGYPVDKGACTACHDPHASDSNSLLKKHYPVLIFYFLIHLNLRNNVSTSSI